MNVQKHACLLLSLFIQAGHQSRTSFDFTNMHKMFPLQESFLILLLFRQFAAAGKMNHVKNV